MPIGRIEGFDRPILYLTIAVILWSIPLLLFRHFFLFDDFGFWTITRLGFLVPFIENNSLVYTALFFESLFWAGLGFAIWRKAAWSSLLFLLLSSVWMLIGVICWIVTISLPNC